MTAPTEKAAPIPADVSQAALAALRTAIADERTGTAIKMTIGGPASSAFHDAIARAIMKAIVADRAAQEERIREDERAALDLISSYRQEVNAHDFAMRKALEHVRSHFPGAAAEFDAVYEPELRARLRGDASWPGLS